MGGSRPTEEDVDPVDLQVKTICVRDAIKIVKKTKS